MDIEFFGANCFRLKTKTVTVVVDDNLDKLGTKNITKEEDVLLLTNENLKSDKPVQKARLVIDCPGEYEVGDVSVVAFQERGHMDEEGVRSSTVYMLKIGNSSITILGNIHPDISSEALEIIGGTDVLLLPVGGNGFTLDVVGAISVIKNVEPAIVIPSSYHIEGLNYEVPVSPLDEFTKASGLVGESLQSFKLGTSKTETSGQTQIVVLSVSKS